MDIFMMLILVVVSVTSFPQEKLNFAQRNQNIRQNEYATPIPIIDYSGVNDANGTFNFSYRTGNGIEVNEEGFIKKINSTNTTEEFVQVIKGAFSYTAPDGSVIQLRYIADENGFQPQGSHLPTTPTSTASRYNFPENSGLYNGHLNN